MRSRIRRVQMALLLATTLATTWVAAPAWSLDMFVGDVTVADLGSFGLTQLTSELTFDSGVTDEVFEMYGYFGNSGGTVRIDASSFSVLTAINDNGDGTADASLRLRDTVADSLGIPQGAIVIDYVFSLIDDTTGADQDSLGWDIVVNNNDLFATLDVAVYTYIDFDLGGPFDWNDDLATSNTARMEVSDPDDPSSLFVWNVGLATPASSFQVGAWPDVQNDLDAMGAAVPLSNAFANFPAGDFTGAFQFDVSLAPTSSQAIQLNTNAVPEPNSAVLTGIGLIGLTVYGRRRRPRAVRAPADS